MTFPLKRAPKDYQIMEAGCFEGERDQMHLVDGLAKIPDHYEHELNTEPAAPADAGKEVDARPW